MGRRELIAAFARDRYRTVNLETRFMIEHLDGRHVRLPPAHSPERMVARVLEKRGVLRYVGDGAATQITDVGRWLLAELLANLAEILALVPEHPANADLPAETPIYSIEMPAELSTIFPQK